MHAEAADQFMADFRGANANSNSITSQLLNGGEEKGLSQIVGQREPNGFGIYDMIGNVEEWVADGFDEQRIGKTASSNPIVWPLSKYLSPSTDSIAEEFEQRGQFYVDAFGVAKGGTGFLMRPRETRAFTVAARTSPSEYDRDEVAAAPATVPRSMSESIGPAIGFRIARPATIPDRQTQLWHWGVYADQAEWLGTTMRPHVDD